MASTTENRTVTIALIGNPNTGKSTLFNALSGMRQRIGNFPGVTVEKKIGQMQVGSLDICLIDLPGTYSLSPRSPDEMVAVDMLLGRRDSEATPDVLLCIVDASNLERNFYLVSQALELGLPTVIALNMVDLAKSKGIQIEVEKLSERLGVPVVVTRADHREGIEPLRAALAEAVDTTAPTRPSPFSTAFQEEVAAIVDTTRGEEGKLLPRYLGERLLLDTSRYLEQADLPGVGADTLQAITAARGRLKEAGTPVPGIEAICRYGWAAETLRNIVKLPAVRAQTWTDRVDRILTHKLAGSTLFLLMMSVMFWSIFRWAEPIMGAIESLFEQAKVWVESHTLPGALQSLLTDGVIAGVGGVLVFLPQIMILYLFIAVLEDCGYMARAAYLMDKLMSKVGLSGKSFIPMLSSVACAVPGIMAARVIENRRDRLTTILVAPLMSCSARLPVYIILVGAFIPNKSWLGGWVSLQVLTMIGMYSVGIVASVVVAWLLKLTILSGPTPPFVMELPSYKMPSPRVIFHRVADRVWAFTRRAGTIIFAVAILVWAAGYYPHDAEKVEAPFLEPLAQLQSLKESTEDETEKAKIDEQISQINNDIAGAYLHQSYLGRAGQFIEPVVRPLGWDWRIGAATIASFPAREVVIASLGIIYNLGEDQDEESVELAEKLQNATWDDDPSRHVFNVPVALSVMVFFALCAQCAATLAIMRRETNSWRWPLFSFTYMTLLAYFGAWGTYQLGMLVWGG